MISSLPPELLDAIADWIDAPGDLQHLASALQPAHGPLLRSHYEYRSIRCPVNTTCLRSALSINPKLARHVRSLELIRRGGERALQMPHVRHPPRPDCGHCVPSYRYPYASFRQTDDLYQKEERMLRAVLKNTTNLTRFDWSDSGQSYLIPETEPDGQDLWAAIASCPNVTELRVYDRAEHLHDELFGLLNLTVFHFDAAWLRIGRQDFSLLGVMLRERCPNLQELTLSLDYDYSLPCLPADIGESILSGRWPSLWFLHLRCASCSPHAISTFLSAHPEIRHLDIDDYVGCHPALEDAQDTEAMLRFPSPLPLSLAPGSLPDLQTLYCGPGHAFDILPVAFSGPRLHGAIAVALPRNMINGPPICCMFGHRVADSQRPRREWWADAMLAGKTAIVRATREA